jgi:ADA HAT complex component 1
MFSLLQWSVPKSKKVSPDQINKQVAEVEALKQSMTCQVPGKAERKRKRKDSDGSILSPSTCKPPKKKHDRVSHIQKPKEPTCQGDLTMIPAETQTTIHHVFLGDTTPVSNGYTMLPRTVDTGPLPNGHTMPLLQTDTVQHVATNGDASFPPTLEPVENTVPHVQEPQISNDATRITKMQQTIEMQFNLEILLKHRELRLIEQEIAKVQIAQEQLRRCKLIPYPAMSGDVIDMLAVSRGVGPVYRSASEDKVARYPPPWGVTDGPYSRHYDKWLLRDPVFDGGQDQDAGTTRPAGKKMPQRTTRAGKMDYNSSASKPRSQRGSTSRLQALPAGYPEPKEEKGPMIVKRSDGKMVKLVCQDCRRENFNSAQGFINHCRIAHTRQFKSHEEAAEVCGEDIDGEAGPAVLDAVTPSGGNSSLVHPYISNPKLASVPTLSTPKIRKAHSKTNSSVSEIMKPLQHNPTLLKKSSVPDANDPFAHLPFAPSNQTPYLSALLAKSGRGGDLSEIVREATTKIDLTMEDDDQSEYEDDGDIEMVDTPLETPTVEQPQPVHAVLRGGRLPARAAMSPAPLDSASDIKRNARQLRKPQYLDTVSRHDYASPYPMSSNTNPLLLSPHNLSPNTLESNPAPSLVSDDDDDYAQHSESEAPSSEEDEEDENLDIEVNDEEVGGPSVDPELTTSAKAGSVPQPIPQPTRRRSVLRSAGAVVDGTGLDGRRGGLSRGKGGGGGQRKR